MKHQASLVLTLLSLSLFSETHRLHRQYTLIHNGLSTKIQPSSKRFRITERYCILESFVIVGSVGCEADMVPASPTT